MNPLTDHAAPCARRFGLRPSLKGFASLLLLMAGVYAWLMLGESAWPDWRTLFITWVVGLVAITALLIPPTRRLARATVNGLRRPSPIVRGALALVLAGAGGYYLYAAARGQHRSFVPMIHDEHAYLVQSRMLATGKLWLPRHEMADFFDSFHLIRDPVYAAKYSPGTAMMYAPGLAAGWPHWLMPLILSGASIGLLYLVLTEMIDGLAGLLGALMLPALTLFRRISIDAISQAPMLFLALVALWAYLHWRRGVYGRMPVDEMQPGACDSGISQRRPRRRALWMLVVGIAIGWGAITRPVDALSLAVPLGLAIVIDLVRASRLSRQGPWELAPTVRVRGTILAGLIGAMPFLVLQVVYNRGVTGSFTTLPWNYYAQKDDPYDTLGSPPFDEKRRPESTLAQKQKFHDEFTVAAFKQKVRTGLGRRLIEGRLEPTLATALPHPLLTMLLPVGLLALGRRARWVAVGMLPVFLLLYTPYTFFIAHYAVVAAVGVLVLMLAGWDALASSLPRTDLLIRWVGAAVIAALAVSSLPKLQAAGTGPLSSAVSEGDEWEHPPVLAKVHNRLGRLDRTPALVLFKFDTERGNPHYEPVYNIETASPDDAKIIRAHDLGSRNVEIFKYYATRSPTRAVYRYDMARQEGDAVTYLGNVAELAKQDSTR